MIEIFNNALTWVLENSDNIRLIFSILSVIGTAVVMFVTFKHKKTVAKIQDSVNSMSKIVTDYNKIIEEFDNLHSKLKDYELNTNLSIDKMTDVQDVDTDLIKKINAILDVLGLAFSTSKNDAVRIGVATVINEAKQVDPNNAKLVKREIERLVKNKVAAMDIPTEKVEKVNEILKEVVEEVKEEIVTRY